MSVAENSVLILKLKGNEENYFKETFISCLLFSSFKSVLFWAAGWKSTKHIKEVDILKQQYRR